MHTLNSVYMISTICLPSMCLLRGTVVVILYFSVNFVTAYSMVVQDATEWSIHRRGPRDVVNSLGVKELDVLSNGATI